MAREGVADVTRALWRPIADDVRLLLTEYITNALRHAGLGPEDTIRASVQMGQGCVDVIVRYPEHVGFPPTLPLDPGETSGWGLLLVDQICDRWSVVVTRGVVEAWFEIDLPQRVAA